MVLLTGQPHVVVFTVLSRSNGLTAKELETGATLSTELGLKDIKFK